MAIMPVPEASVSEKNSSVFRENDIWLARQGPVMQPEPEPGGMQTTSQRQLRFGIFTPDARHHPAAHFRGNDVRHELLPQVGVSP